MHKLLVMTDLHLTSDGQQIIELDPLERLKATLSHAADRHPDAARLVLTGDLTHYGNSGAYELLRDVLADQPWPVSFLLGNHDRRDRFRKVFPNEPVDPNGFVQSAVMLDGLTLIALDTLDEDGAVTDHAGHLCQSRLDWLAEQLDKAGGTPCLLFLHHPPFITGFAGMDDIRLMNASELQKVLAQGSVAHIFAGHIHRTITSSFAGIPATVFKSTCHQMPMLLGENGSHHSVDEPAAYGIVLANGAEVVVHFEDVLAG